jgi:hypothetical protein
VQLLVLGTGGTGVASGSSSFLECFKRFSTEGVGSMTVGRIVPTLVLHHVPGSERWLTESASDVHTAG